MEKVKRKRREWTQGEIERLKNLCDEGKTNKEIADKLQRPEGSVNKKLNMLGKKAYSKSKEYAYSVGEVVNETLKIVEQIRVKRGKHVMKGYIVKSLAYPDDKNDYEINENSLKNGKGCAYVAGKRVCEENSLYSVESIRKYIINIDEAKTIAPRSHKKIKVKCDNCDKEKMMNVDNLVNQGHIACQNCSTGISYSESMYTAYLQVKNIPFETQVKYKEIGLRRYDFLIQLNGIPFLVETHGKQHFLTEDVSYYKVETIQESDSIKRQYAKDNNINYIELDCRKSSFEFIRQQIELNEHLPNINDSDIPKMLELMEINSKHDIKSIIKMYKIDKLTCNQIGEKLNVSNDTIHKILRKNNVKTRSYSEAMLGRVLDEQEIIRLYKSGKSTYQLGEKYGVDSGTIGNILQRNNIKRRDSGRPKRMIRLIETNQIYVSTMEAQRQTGISNNSISKNCNPNNNKKSAGKNKHTSDKLHWKTVSQKEQQAIDKAQSKASNHTDKDINLDDTDGLSNDFMALLG